jgi:isovaleryl-CoA dehydrogenase
VSATETSAASACVAAIEEVSRETIVPAAGGVDRLRAFPSEALGALAGRGALGLLVPVEQGGVGGGLAELASACKAIGSACGSSGMVFLMHSVAAAAVAAGGGEVAPGLLAEMAAGDALGTLAFSERGTGAHFYAPELQAVAEEGQTRISGRKSFVTSGGCADVYLVLVRSAADEEALDCYAIRGDTPGMRFEGSWEGLGLAGNSSIAMTLEDVEVSDGQRIGASGAGAELVFGTVAPCFLVGLAAVNVGIAQAALAAATGHASAPRYGDGSKLAEIQAIQHSLADMEIAVRAARSLVAEAATLGDEGSDGALVALMAAKVGSTEAAERVTGLALEICGGQGYTPSLPVERHLRDARAGRVMAPTNAVLRTWIGKAATGLPVP